MSNKEIQFTVWSIAHNYSSKKVAHNGVAHRHELQAALAPILEAQRLDPNVMRTTVSIDWPTEPAPRSKCPRCQGKGSEYLRPYKMCASCGGTGEAVAVHVPATEPFGIATIVERLDQVIALQKQLLAKSDGVSITRSL